MLDYNVVQIRKSRKKKFVSVVFCGEVQINRKKNKRKGDRKREIKAVEWKID